jgi:phosphoglycerate kinase
VIVLSHFDRAQGQAVPSMSLAPLRHRSRQAIGHARSASPRTAIGASAQAVGGLADGAVLLLENLRFHAAESGRSRFCQGAGGARRCLRQRRVLGAHRAHASTSAIARLLPSYAGRLMQAELEALGKALETPQRPLAAVVGGAKVSTKLELLGNLVQKVDVLVIGGGMANTFLNAAGIEVGRSLCERDLADTARKNRCGREGGRQAHRAAGRRRGGTGLDQGAAAKVVDLPGMDRR